MESARTWKHYGVSTGEAPHPAERRFTARVLGSGLAGPEALRLLLDLAGDQDPEVRREAYEGMVRFSLEELRPHFARLLACREHDPWVAVAWVRLLGRCHPLGPSQVTTALTPVALMPWRWVQEEVIRVVTACAKADPVGTWGALKPWFTHESEHVRETALRCLRARPERLPAEAVEVVCRGGDDASALVRRASACAASRMALVAPEVLLPLLMRLSRDSTHWAVRLSVARGLGHWQEAAPFEALAILESLLDDPHLGVRRAAVRQLHRLAREHPALALDVATSWYQSHHVRRRVVVTCLRAVTRANEPTSCAHALGLLRRLSVGG